jgi:hypothetical protein
MKQAIGFFLEVIFVHGGANDLILFAGEKVGDLKGKDLARVAKSLHVEVLVLEQDIGMVAADESGVVLGGDGAFDREDFAHEGFVLDDFDLAGFL